ncbi:MAG: flagellar export protein FliJ [Lachnospiraceae bacterium]|nr:flagellar export protein FliJ [Lachnospiraceae bacterium]MEE0686232.1 flagellar export protein FliJ [Lachnospiraceae bacterium]MEE0862201.1 flagellar export protein FliJ [Lachnospiraceae bacterium]
MAKFIYKMQNILDIKNKLETQEKTAFAIEVQKLRVEEERLVRIRNEIEYYEDLIRGQGDKQINILEWKRCNEALEYKKNEEKIQIQHIKLAEKNVDIARGRLNKVMVERKTQEVLKEKAFEEFVKELNESEKKEVDELVSFTYNNT